tara:strand:- start:1544 stop:1831 length:288 start_codon:yes stop_codon:yes gene_type:complete
MLLKIKQLIIENSGYKRNIVSKNIYINSTSIVSITDYAGAESFLISEGSSFTDDNFSLIKINQGNVLESVIAFGSAEKIYSEINQATSGRQILND